MPTTARTETKKPRTALAILQAARKLLSKEERWTRGGLARDSDGVIVEPQAKEAVCWCAMGAVHKQRGPSRSEAAAERRLFETMPETYRNGGYLGQYNDDPNRTHPDLLAWIDRAIAAA